MSATSAGAVSLHQRSLQSLQDALHDSPLQPIIVNISTEASPNQVPKPDLEDDQKRWLIIGICLHRVISPALRQYVPPEVNKFYTRMVNKYRIDTQVYQKHQKKYSPTQTELNYEAINNNRAVPKVKGKKDVAKYDYRVTSDVDFTKLFLQTHMAHYTAFDDTCDLSALLGIIINIDFPQPVQAVAGQVRGDVRNVWAHCNFVSWNPVEYMKAFQQMIQLIKILQLPIADEKLFIAELTRWQTNGIQFLEGTTLGIELVQELKKETSAISKYMLKVVSLTDERIEETNAALLHIENCLQTTIDRVCELEKRSIELEDATKKMDVDVCQLKETQADMLNSLKETSQTLVNLQSDTHDAQKQLQASRETSDEMKKNVTEIQTDVTRCLNEVADTRAEVNYSQKEVEGLKVCMQMNKADIHNLKTDVSKNQDEILATKSAVENIKAGMDVLSQSRNTSDVGRSFFYLPDRIQVFIAREDEIDQLSNRFSEQPEKHYTQVICGLGGIGKTTLALEYAWRKQSLYPSGLFWMSAESNEALEDSLNRLAIDTDNFRSDIRETLHKVLKWLSSLQNQWLLIIDNVDTDELTGAIKELVLGSWKRLSKGHIIVTSRRAASEAESEFHVETNDCITLDTLTSVESKQFMNARTGLNQDIEDFHFEQLLEELGGLPLALEQAAAHIRAIKCTYQEYLEKFQRKRLKFLKAMKNPSVVPKERSTIWTTWHINFELIAKQSQEDGLGTAAVTAMEIAAYLFADEIPLCIFNTGSPEVANEDLVDCLQDSVGAKEIAAILSRFSLFQGSESDIKALGVHRLVQEVIRENIVDTEHKMNVIQCAARMVNKALETTQSPAKVIDDPSTGFSSLYLWSKLAVHANIVRKHLFDFAMLHSDLNTFCFSIEATRLLQTSSIYHSLNQRQDEALTCQEQMLNIIPAMNFPDQTVLDLTRIKIPLLTRDRLLIQSSITKSAASQECKELMTNDPEILRKEGNEAFKHKDYHTAIKLYSEAMRVSPKSDCRILSNRSLAYLKICQYEKALQDADNCIYSYQDNREENQGALIYKAHMWKAYAIASLIHLGQLSLRWKYVGLASAAVAGHLNPQCLSELKLKVEYPIVRFVVIEDDKELKREIDPFNSVSYTTLLLRKGRYSISATKGEVIARSMQIIGIEEGVDILNHGSHIPVVLVKPGYSPQSVKAEPVINVHMENVFFPPETGQIVVRPYVYASFYRCKFSNGGKACDDYPSCKGGPGCVNPNPRGCERTYSILEKDQELSPCGIAGYAGVSLEGNGKVLIDSCTLDRCGGGGVLCLGKDSMSEVKNSVIRNMRQLGVEARDFGTLIVEQCTISNNQMHGVAVGPQGKAKINNNIIENNGREGIWCGGILKCVVPQTMTNAQEMIKTNNPLGGSFCVIKDNLIRQNGMSGISLDGGYYEVAGNRIFDNWLWGLMVKSRSTTLIRNNDIFENKCGGIRIGVNYSAPVVLDGNTIRDHTGPGLHTEGFSADVKLPVDSKSREALKSAGFIEDEAACYTLPPIVTNRNIVRKNEQELQHPTTRVSLIQTCCFCHNCSKRLRHCSKCKKASYCSKECQSAHWQRHKNLCRLLLESYVLEIPMIETQTINKFYGLDEGMLKTINANLPDIGKGIPPDKKGNKRFIIKIQSGKEYTGYEPTKYLWLYDQTQKLFIVLRQPQLYHLVCECGILCTTKFTTKKIYCWASFKDNGNSLCVHVDSLPPFPKTW